MMMMGLYFMREVPFRRVLLSGLIVDETGEKMSKVKGNVIDPLDLIQGSSFANLDAEALTKFKKSYPSVAQMDGFVAFGADAVRFTLATYPPSNMRIALAPKRIEGHRHFINKIWNATRLSLELLGDVGVPAKPPEAKASRRLSDGNATFNRWILSRLSEASRIAREGIESFRIDEAANELYRFFWDDFCSWYLEIIKPELRDAAADKAETRATLAWVLGASLRLLHPFIPFVTEELWQRLAGYPETFASIALERYPGPGDSPRDEDIERRASTLMDVITAARTIRSEHQVNPMAEPPLMIRGTDAALAFLRDQAAVIALLVKSSGSPAFEHAGGARPKGYTMSVVPTRDGAIEVLVGLKGLVDPAHERARIERELKKIDKDVAAIHKKLSSPSFTEKAPKEIIEEARAQQKSLEEARARLLEARSLADEL
jgi:valyl-tRNA synthetase